MNDFIIHHEISIRLTFFFGIFIVMALWEVYMPCRELSVSKALRWTSNLSIAILNSILLRILFPAAATGMALFSEQQGWGIFNSIELPFWLTVFTSVVILDLAIYLQHVMLHAIPLFWRLHRVHHADLDFDVTTGARFHPIEIILSMLIKFSVIALLGPPVVAVVIFEILLNATAMFNHSNIRLPLQLDGIVRLFIVTPDMHRVHHSIEDDETNSNFGFNLSIWDRIFGTYRAQPRNGHKNMTIGIRTFREKKDCSQLPGMLAMPFARKISGYAINRRTWNDNNNKQ